MNLKELSEDEIIELYSKIIKELKSRKIIRTNNIVGELGEHIVINTYNKTPNLTNLERSMVSTQNVDALGKNGKRYSIKTTTTNTTGAFTGLSKNFNNSKSNQAFEYLIICKLNENYTIEHIYEIDWPTFLKHKHWHSTMKKYNIVITKSLIKDAVTII